MRSWYVVVWSLKEAMAPEKKKPVRVGRKARGAKAGA